FVANPFFDDCLEFFGLLHQLIRFGISRYVGRILINLVPFAAARIKVRDKCSDVCAHGQSEGFECRLMVAWTYDPVSLTSDHHLRELQDGIVRHSEAAVCRNSGNLSVPKISFNSVPKISFNDGAQVVKLRLACLVWLNQSGGS